MRRYGITDGSGSLDAALRLLDAGPEFLQVREKTLAPRALLALSRALIAAAAGRATRILINDRLDVALAAGAAGVHLPAAGLPAARVRSALPPGFLVAASCHAVSEVAAAAAAGCDCCVLGPIFPTPSKPGAPGLGLDALREVRNAGIAVFALGGVNEANAAECLAAGAAGVAGIRMFAR